MDGNTLHNFLILIASLLGGILLMLCVLFVVVKKAANEIIAALQAVYDSARKDRSPGAK